MEGSGAPGKATGLYGRGRRKGNRVGKEDTRGGI